MRLSIVVLAILAALATLTASPPARAGNALAGATSPYLRLHANDAIPWQPWSDEAFETARRENKLVFLSIGYSSCHWCHVMARTTFADPEVIRSLTEDYVPVLVDREERPDLDGYFLAILAAMGEAPGWPANLFLTPDRVPLWGGGYLPPRPEAGQPGFADVANSLGRAWRADADMLLARAETTRAQIEELFEHPPLGPGESGVDVRAVAAAKFAAAIDPEHGGFGRERKFPRPVALSFLLRQGARTGDASLVAKATLTLDHMAAGAIHDHLGGAYHRYTVDRAWQVPHFEIMLYDNALLARTYLEAWQATGESRHLEGARGILDDLLDRFRLVDGGFASALDADSVAGEGAFYTWTWADLEAVLGTTAEPFATEFLDDKAQVIRFKGVPSELPKARRRWSEAMTTLARARARRPAPPRDDKAVTSWNALAASAFALGARITGEARYLDAARAAVEACLTRSPLRHARFEGRGPDEVFLEDHAFLVESLLDLYETEFQPSRLEQARELAREMLRTYQPAPGQPLLFSPVGKEGALARRMVLDEDDLPGGNAAALVALRRLALFEGGGPLDRQAAEIVHALGRYLETHPTSAPGLLAALDYGSEEAREIVIAGSLDDPATQALLREARRHLLPGTVVAVVAPGEATGGEEWLLLAPRPLLDGKPAVYVCRKRICDLPLNEVGELANKLKEGKPGGRGASPRPPASKTP